MCQILCLVLELNLSPHLSLFNSAYWGESLVNYKVGVGVYVYPKCFGSIKDLILSGGG